MKRIVFLLFANVIFCVSVSAQAILTVLEKETNRPVAGLLYDGEFGAQKQYTSYVVDPIKVIGQFTNELGQIIIDTASLPATITFYDEAHVALLTTTLDKGFKGGTVVLKRSLGTMRGNSLKEFVVTGTPTPVRLKNALSQYRVIDMEESKAQGNITLADALSTQLNINVGNDQLLGSNVQLQGLNGSKIKVLIDGLPVNGRENGNVDMGQINLNNIARIEVVQGPMSVVYGSDALGGVINLITKKHSKPWDVNGGVNYESVGKYNADAAVSRSWQHHRITLGGGRNYFTGWGDLDTGALPHRRLFWKPKEQYLANGAYTYTSDSGFKVQLASDFVQEKVTNKGAAFVSPAEGYAFDEYYRTTRSNNRLMLEGNIGRNGHWESKNNYAYYHRVKERTKKDLVSLEEILTEQSGDQDTSTFNDINLRSNYSNRLGRLKYNAGYDVSLQSAYSGKIPGGMRSIQDYALYENFSHALLKDKMTIQAGLRQSHNTGYKAPFIYSLQTLYTPTERIQLRASYANGFRAPTLKEQYLEFIDQNHHVIGNPNLKAEYSDAFQVSASWQAYQQKGDYVQFIVTGFYNNVRDQIALAKADDDPNSIDYVYANVTRIKNVIANFQLEQQWRALHLVLEYGLTHTWGQSGFAGSYNRQELVARAQYYWKKPALSFSVYYKLNGETPAFLADADGSFVYNGELPTYSMLDASLARKFWNKRVEVLVGVKNLLDVQQVSVNGVSGTGGAHSTDDGSSSFLPRRVFTTVRLRL